MIQVPEKPSILVIDDEKDLVEDMIAILENENYSVVSASDGSEGIFKLENQRFDAVVTDLNMPKTDGVGVIDAIRKSPTASHLPIIVLSGNFDQFRAQVSKHSNVYVLEKPFKSADLKNILKRVFSRSEKELKIEKILVPEILKTAKATLSGLLERLPLGKNFIVEDFEYSNGPFLFESAVTTYQHFAVNNIDGSIYMVADVEIAKDIGEVFGKEVNPSEGETSVVLHAMFFFARAVSLKIAQELKAKKARVSTGVPNVSCNLAQPFSNLVEKTYRYGKVEFVFGETRFTFIYKYN